MQDIRCLMVLAYTATTSDKWESVAINAFLEALDDPELAQEIRKRGCSTFDNVYKDALLLEGFYRASAKPENTKVKNPNIGSTTDVSSEMRHEIENLKSQMQQRDLRYNQQLLEKGIETDQQKIEAVVNWPIPREVRGFLGLCG